MSLSDKSDSEISDLLTQYGIKHGPIIDSTRRLYERKLLKAIEEAAPVQTSPDKTYYREEEVVTYVTYHTLPRFEGSGDMLKHRATTEPNKQEDDEEENSELDKELPIQSATRKTNYSAVQSKGPMKKTVRSSGGGGVWRMIQLLLVLSLLAAASYYVFYHVMNNEENQGVQ